MKYTNGFFPTFPAYRNKFYKFMATVTLVIALLLYLGFDIVKDKTVIKFVFIVAMLGGAALLTMYIGSLIGSGMILAGVL